MNWRAGVCMLSRSGGSWNGEMRGDEYDQDTLLMHMKFSKNQRKTLLKHDFCTQSGKWNETLKIKNGIWA